MKTTKTPWILMAVAFLAGLLPLGAASSGPSETPTNPSGFVIRRGTNLSHWLSQDFGWQPKSVWITENDFKFLARQGFDHVRLPVDEKELWADDGSPIESAFSLLNQALVWAKAAKLRVIVDLHTVRTHHFNAVNEGGHNTLFTDPKAQDAFLDLWGQLSSRLHSHPVSEVAYEIMNEPVADDPEQWNALVAKAHAFLRSREPNRVIVIGANRWQIPSMVPFLKVPAGDKNIILSTHTYSPLVLTHYTADWLGTKVYKGPVQYPGPIISKENYDTLMKQLAGDSQADLFSNAQENWNAARIEKEFEPAVTRARELGLQLYCGEFGCLPSVPRAARLAYYRDLITVMENNGMAWANWEYKGDFGILEWHGSKYSMGAPDVELLEVLLQGVKPHP